jgi:hypothetical protein
VSIDNIIEKVRKLRALAGSLFFEDCVLQGNTFAQAVRAWSGIGGYAPTCSSYWHFDWRRLPSMLAAAAAGPIAF